MVEERILYLTIKKKWFDLIKSGKKKFEYREIKPYWTRRLMTACLTTKRFDYVVFINGYRKDSSRIKVEWKGLKWKKYEGKEHYAIKLGKVIDENSSNRK